MLEAWIQFVAVLWNAVVLSMSDAERRFRLIYEAEGEAILGYALRRVRRPADAADVVADTFTVVWRRLEDVPVGADTRPYVFGIARGVLANHRRSTRRRSRLTQRLGSAMTNAVDQTVKVDTEHDVAAAMAKLSAIDQEVLRLVAWEGLSPSEIAIAFGVPPATARSQIHRARERLRHEMGAEQNSSTQTQRGERDGQVPVSKHPLAADQRNPR